MENKVSKKKAEAILRLLLNDQRNVKKSVDSLFALFILDPLGQGIHGRGS